MYYSNFNMVLSVSCPFCGSDIDAKCTRGRSGKPLPWGEYHSARVAKAEGRPFSVKVQKTGPTDHDSLVQRAVTWLQGKGCKTVFAEMVVAGCMFSPDALGFGTMGHSTLVEVKVSRSDFRRDLKKQYHVMPHLLPGTHRYYMAPAGIIPVEALPPKWGLIETYADLTKIVVQPVSFDEPGVKTQEVRFLVAAARRWELGVPYTAKTGRFKPYSET